VTRERQVVGPEGGLQVSPAFLPGGERVVYLRSAGNDCGIVEAGVDDWRVRVPCPTGMRQRFDLAPDGSRIVASAPRQPDRPPALVEVELATGAQRWLTEPEPGGGGDTLPRYAPDGRSIAFFRGTDSQRELWLLERDAAQAPRRVGTQAGLAYGAAFLPGAKALLVSADWPGFRALNRVDLATGREELVGSRGARFPDVAANGDIVFELATYKANLWRIDPSGAREPAIAWPSPRYTSQPALDPAGKRVVFVSNRDGGEALYVAPLDGEATRVPGGDDWRTTRARWSADGRALYAVRTKRGEPASDSTGVRIDPATGEATTLAWLGGRVHDVTPAPDGRTLYVGEQVGHAVRIHRTGVDGGTLERLPLPLASEFRVAGDLLAFSQPQLLGLTVCRMPELACRSLPVPVDDNTRFDWTLATDAIWVHVNEGGSARLVRFDPATGRETLRLPLGPTALGTSIAAGPGGVPLFVSREAPVEIDLMVAPSK
jgi:Tol biopolymer transport system component